MLSIAASFVVSLIIGGVLGAYLSRQTEDVAQRTAAIVVDQVVADARAQRTANDQRIGRDELARANNRLTARSLPIVPDPGPDAQGPQLLVQAARANVLADLPESTVADLRRDLAGQRTLPSSLAASPGSPIGDVVVDVLPDDDPDGLLGATPPGLAPAPGGGGGQSGSTPPRTRIPSATRSAPAPPAESPQPRPLLEVPLLPLCIPGLLNTC